MPNRIKILVRVGYDASHEEQAEIGVLRGKEMVEEGFLTDVEAWELIQAAVDGLSYEEAQKFAEKYKK